MFKRIRYRKEYGQITRFIQDNRMPPDLKSRLYEIRVSLCRGHFSTPTPGVSYSPKNYDEFYFPLSAPIPILNDENSLLTYARDYMREAQYEGSFVERLLSLIDRSQRGDVAVYKAAGLDRRLFSKISSDRKYRPSKDTCIALALALHLSFEEANDLLSRAGFILSRCIDRDLLLGFCFQHGIYDLKQVNDLLYLFSFKTL